MKKIIRLINHFKRGREYVAMLQSMMIGVIFLEQFNIDRVHYVWIIPATVVSFVMLGYFEKKHGIFKADQAYRNSQNPEIMNINKKIDEIYKKIYQ